MTGRPYAVVPILAAVIAAAAAITPTARAQTDGPPPARGISAEGEPDAVAQGSIRLPNLPSLQQATPRAINPQILDNIRTQRPFEPRTVGDAPDARRSRTRGAARPAEEPAAPRKPFPTGGGRADCRPKPATMEFNPDWSDAELLEVIKVFAELTCRNFILTERVKNQKVSIYTPRRVTLGEAWEAFQSSLEVRGFTLVEVGRFYKIIQFRDAMRAPIPVYSDRARVRLSDEVITFVLKLKHLDGKEFERTLNDLLTDGAKALPFWPNNSFVITDTAVNIQRLLRIVEMLDVPGSVDRIHILPVEHALASEVAQKINEIFGGRGGQGGQNRPAGGAPPPGVPAAPGGDAGAGGGGVIRGRILPVTKVISDDRTNQLIVVCTREALAMVLTLVKEIDVPIPGDGQVHVYYLENANAEEMAQTLSQIVQGAGRRGGAGGQGGGQAAAGGLFEGEVRITANKQTNALVVVATVKDFNAVKRVIERLDIPRRQVFVEAVIMELTLTKNRNLGLAMNGGFIANIDGQRVPIFAATTFGRTSSLVLDPTSLQGLALGLRGPTLPGTQGLLGGNISLPAFGVVLQALQSSADANVLSTPHLLTMDNEEAQIIVGSNVPFITGQARDINNRPVLSVNRQDVALTLKVKPQVNESDFVRLQLEQEITEVVSISETLGPTTTKRAAKTVVVVRDNQTVVIGGLMKDKVSEDRTKVPVLGDIPVLGWLFRTQRISKEKTNLLIFLTPHIIKDEEDFRRIFRRKMQERAEYLRRFYGEDDTFDLDIDYARTVGLVESIRATVEEEQRKAAENAGEGNLYVMPGRRGVRTLGEDESTPESAPARPTPPPVDVPPAPPADREP